MRVLEEKGILNYLQKRQLLKQYQQAKRNLQAGRFQQISLKKRQPKSFQGLQFRITQKYRAYGYFKDPETLL